LKQLTIISGKGGTGKTSITAAFASIAKNAVFADCDVDTTDLHLILKPKIKKTLGFKGLKIADINKEKCIDCKKCFEYCKFDAINRKIELNKDECEGCGVCSYICPVDAIKMVDRNSGFAYISDTRFGPMSHAILKTAEEASGKLVTLVRENAIKIAENNRKDFIIIDGPPGIGCPVISSISGVDLVLIVTEPTLSAIHDLERIVSVTNHFKIPFLVCINKFDINEENTMKIKEYCKKNNIEIIGKLPYDNIVSKAMCHEKTLLEYSNDSFSQVIIKMWDKIIMRLIQ
jgi:MinD superfamily P-loop ATPase